MKYIVFRFDVDTNKCLKEGVPNLVKLAKKKNVSFTFFVNPGRSIDRSLSLKKFFLKSKTKKYCSLSSFQKLGLKDFLKTIVFNQAVINTNPESIVMLYRQNHEIGLHGGRNHQQWHEKAGEWSEDKIENEVKYGLKKIKLIDNKIEIKGFASPGWKSNQKLISSLKRNSFRYIADAHGIRFKEIRKKSDFKEIPTNILGEPGGVGYLEYCRARGMNDEELLKDFSKRLKSMKSLAVMYDHPFFAGTKEIIMLEKMIDVAKNLRFKFTTLEKL